MYVIPATFRKIENMHILFWLVKDLCWCLIIKWLGIVMIVPTLAVAIYIAWRSRRFVAEVTHNIAIALWIIANSMWMISEFYGVDEKVKPYCAVPFALGLLILLYFYLIYAPIQKRKKAAVVTTTSTVMEVEETIQ